MNEKQSISDRTIPEARGFLEKVNEIDADNQDDSLSGDFGHAVRGVASRAYGHADIGEPAERQLQLLKDDAQELVREFGENIIPLLREDLKLALSEKDLKPPTKTE